MGLPQLAAAAIHIASSSALGKWETAAEDYQQLARYYMKLKEQLGLVEVEDAEHSSPLPELPPLPSESDIHQTQVLKKLEAIRSKMGKAGAIKLVEAYDHDLHGVEERVIEALRKKDLEAIKSICHFLSGCYKSLNAKEAAQHCKEMNEYACQNDWRKATEQYVPMFQAIRSVSQALAIFKADNEDSTTEVNPWLNSLDYLILRYFRSNQPANWYKYRQASTIARRLRMAQRW